MTDAHRPKSTHTPGNPTFTPMGASLDEIVKRLARPANVKRPPTAARERIP
jgi:hypothetical protein